MQSGLCDIQMYEFVIGEELEISLINVDQTYFDL